MGNKGTENKGLEKGGGLKNKSLLHEFVKQINVRDICSWQKCSTLKQRRLTSTIF